MTDTGRPAAYADLLAALLAVRSDPATARFDTELAAAEADGRIDGHTARTLRWWQRESLRGLAEHLDTVLPQLLTHLAASDRVADESVRESASSWDGAIASQVESVPPAGSLAVPETLSPEAYDRPFGAAHLRPVDPLDSVTEIDAPTPPRLLRPGFAPLDPGPESNRADPSGAPRTRLIAGGLTVSNDSTWGSASTPRSPDLFGPDR